MWISTGKKLVKFHENVRSLSENIAKCFRKGYILDSHCTVCPEKRDEILLWYLIQNLSDFDKIWYIVFWINLLQNDKRFPSYLNNVSTLPCETYMLIRQVLSLCCYRKKFQDLFHLNCGWFDSGSLSKQLFWRTSVSKARLHSTYGNIVSRCHLSSAASVVPRTLVDWLFHEPGRITATAVSP